MSRKRSQSTSTTTTNSKRRKVEVPSSPPPEDQSTPGEPIAAAGFRFDTLQTKLPKGYEYLDEEDLWEPSCMDGWQPVSTNHDLQLFASKYYKAASQPDVHRTFVFAQKNNVNPYTIRKHYPALVKKVMEHAFQSNVLILGPPGVGKTVAMYFIMACMLAVRPEQHFLYVARTETYLFYHGEVYRHIEGELPGFKKSTKPPSHGPITLCFADSPEKNFVLPFFLERQIDAPSVAIIQATSPRQEDYAFWYGKDRNALVLSLPNIEPEEISEEIVTMLSYDTALCEKIQEAALILDSPEATADNEADLRERIFQTVDWGKQLSAVISYQARRAAAGPLDTCTTRRHIRLLVSFYMSQFGHAIRDVRDAIYHPRAGYNEITAAISSCERGHLANRLRRLKARIGQGLVLPDEEFDLLFVIIPHSDVAADGDVIVDPEWTFTFKSDFVMGEVTSALLQWKEHERRELYDSARKNLGSSTVLGAFLSVVDALQRSE